MATVRWKRRLVEATLENCETDLRTLLLSLRAQPPDWLAQRASDALLLNVAVAAVNCLDALALVRGSMTGKWFRMVATDTRRDGHRA